MMRKEMKLTLTVLVVMAAALAATDALAVTSPSGGFAQDVYDIFVTRMLKGPIGFVGGCIAVILGAILVIQHKIIHGAGAVIGGAIILKADAIVESLGAVLM